MQQNHITNRFKDSALDQVKTMVKAEISPAIAPELSNLTDPIPTTHLDNFKNTKEVQKIIEVFQSFFKSHHLRHIGLNITFNSGKWYLPWNTSEYSLDLEPSSLLLDAKHTKPSFENPAQQSLHELRTYLADKLRARDDTSMFAKPYKTLLAKLCHKCIERILTLPQDQQQEYFVLLKQFLDAIWSDSTLITPNLRHDKSRVHIEHYIRAQMVLCAERECFLACAQPKHELGKWLEVLDQELAAIHICGARTFHYLLQSMLIPENLEQQLRTLSKTYNRLVANSYRDNSSCERKNGLSLPIKDLKYWKKVSSQAHNKLKSHAIELNEEISIDSLTLLPLVTKGHITLEEAIFFNVTEHLSADQCIYLALIKPSLLPLSESEKIDLFGTEAFLQLYRTPDPKIGFQWILWHLQQASQYLLPALQLLEQSDDTHSRFSQHILTLSSQVQRLRETHISCPPITPMGIFPEIVRQAGYQSTTVIALQHHLNSLQQQLHSLVLVRALLSQYRMIVPQIGEIIGALVLRTDLLMITQLVNHAASEIHSELEFILSLQGMGYAMIVDSTSQYSLVKQPGLLDIVDGLYKPSPALTIWRSHKPAREKAIGDLQICVTRCCSHLRTLQPKLSITRLEQLKEKTRRQFQLVRMILMVGFSPQITPEQQANLRASDETMSNWLALVDKEITKKRSFLGKSEPEAITLETQDDKKEEKFSSTPKSEKIHLKTDLVSKASLTVLKDNKTQSRVAPRPSTPQQPVLPKIKIPKINTHAENMLDVVNQITRKITTLIQTNSYVSPHLILAHVNQEIHQQQEFFYEQFGQVRQYHSEQQWSIFFKNLTGFLYYPLPAHLKPKHFLWWYRHTLLDREFFFRTLCLNSLIASCDQLALNFTLHQKRGIQQLLVNEKNGAAHQASAHASWLDGIHCQLHLKYTQWHKRLCQKEVKQVEIISKKSQSDLIVVHPENETTTLGPSSIPVSNITSSPRSSSLKAPSFESLFPIDIIDDCKQWEEYKHYLAGLSPLVKQGLCVAFLQATLLRIRQGRISFELNPMDSQHCRMVIKFFWDVIKVTHLVGSLLCVSLENIHTTFIKHRGSVQHYFFVQKAQHIVETYSSSPDIIISNTS